MKLFQKLKISQFKANILSGFFIQGLNIIIVFISYPIYISLIGFDLFSVWSLLSVIITFSELGNFGIGNAIISKTSEAMALQDKNKVMAILSNSILLILTGSLIIQLLIWIFRDLIIHLLSIPPGYYAISFKAIPLLGIAIFTYLINDSYRGILAGMGRFDLSNYLLVLSNILKVTISILLLYAGFSLTGLIYGIIISNLLVLGIILFILKWRTRLNPIKISRPDFKVISSLLGFGSKIIGIQALNLVTFPLIKMVLSRTTGLNSVGYFELATKVAYFLRSFFERGLIAVLPEISSIKSNLNITDYQGSILKKVKEINKKLLWYAIPFLLAISALSPVWIRLWIGESYHHDIVLGYLILQVGVLAGLMALPSYYALMGSENERFCFFEALIRTIFIVILIPFYFFFDLNVLYAFALVSISALFSNIFIMRIFNLKFKI